MLSDADSDMEDEDDVTQAPPLVTTKLYEWFCSYFAQSVMKVGSILINMHVKIF